jgi:hypothetical protein
MQSRLISLGALALFALAHCSSGQTTDSSESTSRSMPSTGCVAGKCDDGEGSYLYPGGEKYMGTFKGGLRDGKGTLEYPSGDRYVGEFSGDKRNGNGTYTFANGDVYVGQFKDGSRQGDGVYTFKAGPVFTGAFQNDGATGTGNLKVDEKLRSCVLQDRKILCEAEKK